MTEAAKDEKTDDTKKEDKPTPTERTSVTQHTLQIGGQELRYTATAGTMILKEEDQEKGEKPKASVFYIAYTLDGVSDPAQRPLTFSFNGGPGSSSVWLHLGILGPKRVLVAEPGSINKPPYQMEDNQFSLLDKTDLVFIDPVSTGYSRAVPGEKAEEFHDIKKDVEIGSRVHPIVYHPQQTLDLAQIRYRRKLRHHAGCRTVWASSAAAWHVP